MRRTTLVFAVVASLLMFACAAAKEVSPPAAAASPATKGQPQKTEPEKSTFGELKETIMSFIGPFLQSGVLTNFKLSSVLGLFDLSLEDINYFGKSIDELHEQSLKEHKELQSIRDWAQAAAAKAKQSGELTQKLSFISTKEETGKKQVKEIEKQKEIVEDAKKEANNAVKDFDTKQALLVQMVVNLLTAKELPSSGSLMGLATGALPIATGMYSSFKKVGKASATAEEAFQAAKQATITIKQYIKESHEIEKSLQTADLKHTTRRSMVGGNGAIISDVSSGFSLLQNAVFLTLVAAFLIADKPLW